MKNLQKYICTIFLFIFMAVITGCKQTTPLPEPENPQNSDNNSVKPNGNPSNPDNNSSDSNGGGAAHNSYLLFNG